MFIISVLVVLIGSVSALDTSPSLLEMIRNDPKALASLFETADPTKIYRIKQLLFELLNEGNDEIKTIDDSISACKKRVEELKNTYSVGKGQLQVYKDRYDAAEKEVAKHQGILEEAKTIFDRDSPELSREVTVFEKVQQILEKLLNNNGESLAEEDTSEVRAFISLEDQADPVKVKKIMDIIDQLLETSRDELAALKKIVDDAVADHEAWILRRNRAYGTMVAGEAAVVAAKKAWDTAVGQCDLTTVNGNTRKNVIRRETATLESIIILLRKLN